MGNGGSYVFFSRDEKIKNSKPFYLKDVFIYASVLLLFILFIFLFLPKKNTDSDGFKIIIGGNEAVTYYYGGDFSISHDYIDSIKIEDNTITIYVNAEKTDYNVLTFNDEKKTVKMTKSSCPKHDCELMEGEIYCAPHKLKITSITQKKDIVVG